MSNLIARVKDNHCGRTIHISAFVALECLRKTKFRRLKLPLQSLQLTGLQLKL